MSPKYKHDRRPARVQPQRWPTREPLALNEVRAGHCRWCHQPIISASEKNRGKLLLNRTWHHECKSIWCIATSSSYARRAVWRRDKGLCAACGTICENDQAHWRADHIVPLAFVDRSDPNAFDFWTMANLQTLCTVCHQKKTDREARTRAKVKRIRKKHGLGRRPKKRERRPEPDWLRTTVVSKIQKD